MVTLTYAPGIEWLPRQVSAYLNCVEKWAERNGATLRAVMSLEVTGAGIPHYHVLLWLPRRLLLPKADKRGWWPHGMTNTKVVTSAVGYVSKYVSKAEQSALPRGARCCSVRGLSAHGRMHRSWHMLPKYIHDQVSAEDRVQRAPGGGFASMATGELYPSRWRLVERGPNYSWLRFERVD